MTSNDEDYDLWILLAQARAAMFRARQKELSRYNLTPRQSAVLFTIKAIGHAATPAEISRWLFRESHSISNILTRMEKQGLLNKVKDLHRKNLVRVELTAEGLEAYNHVMKRESIHKVMSHLPKQKRQQLRSLLLRLRDEAMKEAGIQRELPFPPSE